MKALQCLFVALTVNVYAFDMNKLSGRDQYHVYGNYITSNLTNAEMDIGQLSIHYYVPEEQLWYGKTTREIFATDDPDESNKDIIGRSVYQMKKRRNGVFNLTGKMLGSVIHVYDRFVIIKCESSWISSSQFKKNGRWTSASVPKNVPYNTGLIYYDVRAYDMFQAGKTIKEVRKKYPNGFRVLEEEEVEELYKHEEL